MSTNETRPFPIDTSALQGRQIPKDQTVPEIPGYLVEGVLGAGGMAVVYLATQKALQRPVALKVLSEHLASNPEFRGRFLNEARMVARLRHPHIISVFDSGESNGTLYIASDYMDGGTLKDRIRKGLSREQSVEVLIQLAEGLSAAHEQKIYHRDMKPDNVLYDTKGHLAIADFGIAKAVDPEMSGNTTTGTALGTPSYMSPEQFSGGSIDGRADIYALGVMFYQMLTGELPFVTADPYQMALAHTTKPFPALPPHLSSLEPMLRRMTAKDPRDRFKSAEEVAHAAKTWLVTRTGSRPTMPTRKRTLSAIVLALAVLAAAGGWLARDLPWSSAPDVDPGAPDSSAASPADTASPTAASALPTGDPARSSADSASTPTTEAVSADPVQRNAQLDAMFRQGKLASWSAQIDLSLQVASNDPVAKRHATIRTLLTEQGVTLNDGATISPTVTDALVQSLTANANSARSSAEPAPGASAADYYRAALTVKDESSVRSALDALLADRITAAEAARAAENWSAVIRILQRALAIDPENEHALRLLAEARSKSV